jgi:hypothetical protein
MVASDSVSEVSSLQVGAKTFLAQPSAYDSAIVTIDMTPNIAYSAFSVFLVCPYLPLFIRFQVNISEYNPFTKAYALTEDYINKKIVLASSYVVLSGLTPGRCLKVDIKAYTGTTTISSSIKYYNPLLQVTCGCPSSYLDELALTEATGTPANVTLKQVAL